MFVQFRAFGLYFGTNAYFAFLSFKEYPLIAGLYSDVDSRGDGGVGGAVWFRSVVDPDSVPRGAAIRYMCRIRNTYQNESSAGFFWTIFRKM